MQTPRRYRSLRLKLVLAALAVQSLVALVTVLMQTRSVENSIRSELGQRVRQLAPFMEAALIDPLIQRDYATLNRLLDEARDPQGVKYLLLLDLQGVVIASAGETPQAPYPPVDDLSLPIPWDRPDGSVHEQLAINFQSHRLATLRYAVALEPSRTQRDQLTRNTIAVTLLGLLLGMLAFTIIGLRLTRGLKRLTDASERIGRGDYAISLPVQSSDEVADVAAAINRMATAVQDRVTELQLAETKQAQYLAQARVEKTRLQALLHAMRLGVLLVDNAQRVLYANESFARIWKLKHADVQREVDQLAPREGGQLAAGPYGALPVTLLLEPGLDQVVTVTDLRLSDGVDLQITSIPVADDAGAPMGRLWLFEDITLERQTQRLVHHLAERDSLTGLLNRHTFASRLAARTAPGCDPLALFFIDLDGFKLVNDLNGHALGDRLLKGVGNALTLTFRPDDLLARLGGDEFAVAMTGLGDQPEQLAAVCERLLRNVANASGSAMAYSSHAVKISCSVGVAWFPKDAQDGDSLIAAADQAMYAAKAAGRNAWRSYVLQAGASQEKAKWLIWSERINDAFAQNRCRIFLQGIHDAKTGAIWHYEALVRLEDPAEPGAYYPLREFIMYAEDSGKVVTLDRMMLARCVSYLARHPEHPAIAVNVSPRTLIDPELPSYVEGLLQSTGVPAHRLHLELTETAALTNIEQATTTVRAVQKLGCRVGLDDFGSGFTSFTYLRELPVDYIKMDGGFVHALRTDTQCQVLLRAVVDIAHAAGRYVIAEWVEDESLLEIVRSYGVDCVQGYLFSQPQAIATPPEDA